VNKGFYTIVLENPPCKGEEGASALKRVVMNVSLLIGGGSAGSFLGSAKKYFEGKARLRGNAYLSTNAGPD